MSGSTQCEYGVTIHVASNGLFLHIPLYIASQSRPTFRVRVWLCETMQPLLCPPLYQVGSRWGVIGDLNRAIIQFPSRGAVAFIKSELQMRMCSKNFSYKANAPLKGHAAGVPFKIATPHQPDITVMHYSELEF